MNELKNFFDNVDLSEWKKKKEILKNFSEKGISIDERTFRNKVKEFNKMFYNHETENFIAHSSNGYKMTTNVEEIKDSIKDNRKRALDMLYEEARIKKAIGENYNMKLEISEKGFIITEV